MFKAILAVFAAIAAGLVVFFFPTPAPTPEPTPSPTPEPTPSPTPKPVLFAPDTAKVGESFLVTYCVPYKANTKLYIDTHFLGTMWHDNTTDCMVLNVALNTAGQRVLKVDTHERPILVEK
jgi:hypothetical protein